MNFEAVRKALCPRIKITMLASSDELHRTAGSLKQSYQQNSFLKKTSGKNYRSIFVFTPGFYYLGGFLIASSTHPSLPLFFSLLDSISSANPELSMFWGIPMFKLILDERKVINNFHLVATVCVHSYESREVFACVHLYMCAWESS